MKKLFITGILIITGSMAILPVNAANKKDKKKKGETTQTQIITHSDSLSYASGMFSTMRLLPYLKAQFNVSEENIGDFIEGLKAAIEKNGDMKQNAYGAGIVVYETIRNMILPRTEETFKGGQERFEQASFYEGFIAGVKKDSTVFSEEHAQTYFNEFYKKRTEEQREVYRKENEDFLKENANKEGVKTTPSGLQYKILTQGTGIIPSAQDEVVVKYAGRTIDGKEFDSSYKRDPQTSTFKANQVIEGWTEALTMMPVGSKWQLFIPSNLAYKERGAGETIKPFSTLIFDVELIDVKKAEESNIDEVGMQAPDSSKPVVKIKKSKKKKK